MPIYGYACEDCGHSFDALQKISDDRLTVCPQCDQPKLKKQLSAPNFRLKGSGWYETDFKTDNRRNLADSGNSEPGQKESGQKESGEKESGKKDSSTGKENGKDSGKTAKKTNGKDSAGGKTAKPETKNKPAASKSS